MPSLNYPHQAIF